MSQPTFIWRPDVGAKLGRKPAPRVAKFGDGYEQRARSGINSNPRVWDVVFTRGSEAILIENFLEARDGVESFFWEDPRGVVGLYKCATWNGASQGAGGVYAVSATFEQVFE